MRTAFAEILTILICYGVAVCQSEHTKTNSELSLRPRRSQELKLTTGPWFDQPPNEFHFSWARVSQNNKRYRLALPKDFGIPKPRPFQFGSLDKYFVIVIDKQTKEDTRYKLLAMYAADHKHWNYRPYWIICNHELSRTKLYNSNIGVVAVEFLRAGGYKVSVLSWDEERKTFTCEEVASRSLSFP